MLKELIKKFSAEFLINNYKVRLCGLYFNMEKKMKSESNSYKEAGVDITSGYKAVELMKTHIAKTMKFGSSEQIGGFGGIFKPDIKDMKSPVLISGTDGVGTKLKLAFLMDKHDTIGRDCVAMCVNDIICQGASPMFFLDYIALGKNYPEKVASIVKGVADGCMDAECALIGGETAEMPGMYGNGEYDLAGFAVGIVDENKMIDNTKVSAGNKIIGIASSGIHSNGYSLVRKIFDVNADNLKEKPPELNGRSLGDVLIEPTRIYVKAMKALFKKIIPNAVMHITGGGFYENIPRALPKGLSAKIYKNKIKTQEIFKLLAKEGNISEHDMYNTYNMGIGMTVVVKAADAEEAIAILKSEGEDAYIIGEIIESDEGVIIE